MLRILTFGLLSAAALYGQHRFSWQNACFNNPAAPYCPGHDFAIKKGPAKKGAANASTASSNASPRAVPVSGIDWRFADPQADALGGFNLRGLSTTSQARKGIAQLGASAGFSETDFQKTFEGLAGVSQIAVSVRDNRVVIMATGVEEGTLPTLDASWKAVPGAGKSMLIGDVDAVDAAVQRLALGGPLPDLAPSFEERQADSGFWVVGSGKFLGAESVSAGLEQFSLAVSVGDYAATDVVFEFGEGANALKSWPMLTGAAHDGNVFQVKILSEADDARQQFARIAASPLGPRLAGLISSTRYVPARDMEVLKQTKPVIYGLESGPKIVQ